MLKKMKEIKLRPIGFVKNNIKKSRFGNFADEISEIVLDKEYTEGLDGIEDYSHIIVVYWLDKVKTCDIRHIPQGKAGDVPEVGIFACRCVNRPNPIGITTVKLLEHNKNKIKVKGLDILDGTPIIDIKPYWPQYDKVDNVKIPNWVNKLEF